MESTTASKPVTHAAWQVGPSNVDPDNTGARLYTDLGRDQGRDGVRYILSALETFQYLIYPPVFRPSVYFVGTMSGRGIWRSEES